MTDSYNQGDINLLDGSPISVQTPDATPLIIQLGAIADGGSLSVDMIGGGSHGDPLLVSANNYVVLTGDVIFTRAGGVGVVTPAGGPVVIAPLGLVPVLTFTIVNFPAESACQLTIVGPAAPYNHRLKYSAIQF
jgi:hypothetical protein